LDEKGSIFSTHLKEFSEVDRLQRSLLSAGADIAAGLGEPKHKPVYRCSYNDK